MSVMLARFTPGRGKLLVTFLGLVMFTIAAAWVLLSLDAGAEGATYARLVLWAALVLCPVFAVDTLVRLIRHTPTIVATEQGLVFRSILGFSAPIPWAEIGGFRAVIMGKKPWLAIYLDNPLASFARMGLWTRLMHARSHSAGVPNIAFRAIDLGVSPAEAAEALERVRQGRGPA